MKISCFSALFLAAHVLNAAPAPTLPATVKDAFEAYASLPGKLIPITRKAQDTASADACAAELRQQLSEVYAVREKLHSMPRLTPELNQQVRLQYELVMRQEWGQMYAELSRLQNNRCFQSAAFAEVFRLLCMMIEK